MAKDLGETTLVMVEALLCCIIYTTDVDNDIARFEDSWIP
jgi:hypothetical protein